MNERLEAIVSGRVQLVMYRDFTRRAARALGLRGEVKNLSDGNVAVVAEGSRANLLELLVRLHKGSVLSDVKGVATAWKSAQGAYQSFEITYE